MKQKKIPLRALIVEDESIDAEFLARNLRKAGYDLEWSSAETEKQYREALATLPDIVLSDYKLPRFSALRALAMLRDAGSDIPFILVSGGVSDEQAIEIMRLGADDFLIKDRLNRLGAAVAAALERRRLRDQTRQVEERLGAFLENSPAITFIKDTAGRYLHVNRRFLQAFGVDAGAVLGKTDGEIFEPAQAAQFRRNDREVLDAGAALTFEEHAQYVDGPHTSLVTKFPLLDARHSPYAIGGFATDITARKAAEERFRTTFEQTTVGIVHSSLDNRYLLANQKFCSMVGYSLEEVLNMGTADIVHPDDLGKDRTLQQQLVNNEISSFSGEKRYRRKDGSAFWVNRTVSLARDEDGTPLYLIRIIEDITRRKEQEECLRATFDQSAVGIALNAPSGKYIEVNDRLCGMLGYTREELLTKNSLDDIIHPDDRENSRERTTRLLSGEVPHLYAEKRYLRKDDSTIHVTHSMSLVHGPDGEPRYIISMITDVTGHEMIKELFTAFFEQAGVGMSLRRPDTRTTRWLRVNQKLCDMLGYTQDELLQLSPRDVTPPEDEDAAIEYNSRLLRNEISSYSRERRYLRKDGGIIWCNTSISTVRGADGRPSHVISVVQDITERKKAEARNVRLNRLYSTLSATSTAIVRLRDRDALFRAICRIAVEEGGLSSAWIRVRDPDSDELCIVAHTGVSKHYFADIRVSIDPEKPEGRGLAGTAFRENRTLISNDLLNEPMLEQWHRRAAEYGFRSLASLPLCCNGEVVAVLGLQAREPDFFDDELVRLLQEMANDISFALTGLSLEAQHLNTLRALQESESRFRQLADNIPQIFWITDAAQKSTIYVSPGYESVTGRRLADLASEQGAWLSAIHEEDREQVLRARAEKAPLGTYDIEYRVVHTDGSLRWIHDRAFPVRNVYGEIYRIAGIAEDITERKAAQEHLAHLAHYDNVTGLPNRVLFQDRLHQSIAQARRNNWAVGLLFLDLDRFKRVNDTFGHAAGDRLLKEVAARLVFCLRPSDTIGRLSGDEFAVILSDLAMPQNAGLVAQKILNSLTAPFMLDNNEVFITTSIGIALYPDDGDDIDTLIRDADAAMYGAKAAGRNNYQYYTAAMNVRATEKLRLEAGLRRALERGEFVLHYQPTVDIVSGGISGLEALLRWQPPEGPLVAPDEFIPLLEETGLIVPVGLWVVRAACAQIRAWREAGVKPVPVAINLSARQLREQGFSRALGQALREFEVDPGHIAIEITESSLMENPELAITMLGELNALGIHLAADDFGTGYSSLSYLKRLPLDALKIDRSFVRDITIDPDDAAITRTVITLAHSLELKVIAEGVETEEQLAFLGDNHCDEAQGYLFSRPLSAEACTALLASGNALHRAHTPESPDHLPAVLVVDDDQDHLLLTRLLLQQDGHRVIDTTSTRDAFDQLATQRVGIVISDQNMPEMSGVEFLRRVKLMYPDVMRVMLSGAGDFGTATAAINEGEVHKFFIKGRDDEKLRREVGRRFRPGRSQQQEHTEASGAN